MASPREGNEGDIIVQEPAAAPQVSASDAPVTADSNGVTAPSGECVENTGATESRSEPTDAVDLSGAQDVAVDAPEDEPSVGEASEPAMDLVVDNAAAVDAAVEEDAVDVAGASHVVDVADAGDEMAATPSASGGGAKEDESAHPTDADSSDAQEAAHDEHHQDEEETDDEDVRYHDDAGHDQVAVRDDDGANDDGTNNDDNDGDAQHNDDEYDPANPTHDMDVDSNDPAGRHEPMDHAQDEYDPANPTNDFDAGGEKSANASGANGSPLRKRKLSDTPTVGSAASPTASNASTRSPKRPRSSTTHKVDQRGLKNSAWDRLTDFESTGEFRIAQVSRAAFSGIAQLPEFAQCAIVARFTRTPMKDVRDKNELILRLCREYLSENPSISSLQPVSVFIDDATADSGLFTYGYAPPMPISGMSTVKIPLRQDKPGTISTPSAPSVVPVKLPKPSTPGTSDKPKLDEFGREIKENPAPRQAPAASAPTSPPVTSTETSTHVAATAVAAGKPSDPRRRRQGGADAASAESAPLAADTRGLIEKSEVYNRLPASVRTLLDGLFAARRLREAINDNVLSRLNHLPESTALTAIEKFMEADLGQISNVNGFLVGIINRVQERGSASSDPRNIISAPRPAHVPGTTFHQQQHPTHQPEQHFQNAPAAQHGYTGAPAPRAAPVPVGHPHSLEHTAGTPHFRDHQMHPPMAAVPVGYDAPQAWNQVHGAAPVQYSAPSGAPTGGRFSSHPTIDKAIAALPVAIQNHLVSLVNSRILPSLDDLSEKCYEVLGQLSEGLANDVLKRFGTANLVAVRNRSAFLMGVVKKCRQEYGFD